MAASKESLELIHDALARAFLDILNNGVKTKDEDGKVVTLTAPVPYLNVIRQFVKDNNIQALALPGSPAGNLAAALPFAGTEEGDLRH